MQVKAVITTRSGGVSSGPFASFNLGLRVGDRGEAVMANRAFLARLLPQEPKWLAQVHGATVVEAEGIETPAPADASVARRPGTVCAVMIADCMPVLLTDRAGTRVAVAHAGWRGLAQGVIENTVIATAVPAADLLAYLGPAIGPQAFEVGADVRDAFLVRDPDAAPAFTPHRPGKWLADIYALGRRALARCGVSDIYGGGLCTVSDPGRFFSYRRDKITGRMAALIWREA
ncbi:MAG: peptidoglycan editing factor PgeF [Betaproteobacteria bacterium]|nr:peptidoglycan editing factor PgeF [Betaproteobacteria bacterium]